MNFLYQRIDKTDKRILDVYRLRYQVYCHECGFENPTDFPDQMERDSYDDLAVHFAVSMVDGGQMIGTIRLVLPSAKPFPLEKNMQITPELLPDFDHGKIGEISRLAISKEFRKRLIDQTLYSDKSAGKVDDDKVLVQKRKTFESQLVAGLYQCVYLESMNLGLTYWYAAMARGLYSLLRRWGVVWHPISAEMDYHGLRRAYISSIVENVEMARKRYPALLTRPNGWNG